MLWLKNSLTMVLTMQGVSCMRRYHACHVAVPRDVGSLTVKLPKGQFSGTPRVRPQNGTPHVRPQNGTPCVNRRMEPLVKVHRMESLMYDHRMESFV